MRSTVLFIAIFLYSLLLKYSGVLFSTQHLVYNVSKADSAPRKSSCNDGMSPFIKKICNIQYSKTRDVVVFADDGQQDRTHCGLGCRWMRLVMALWYAVNSDRGLVSCSHGLWIYTSREHCPQRNEECYFLPFSNLSIGAFHNLTTTGLITSEHLLPSQIRIFTRRSLDDFRERYKFGNVWLGNWGLKEEEGCYVASQILNFLLRPNLDVNKILIEEKRRMKWSRNIAAIHVRHGWRAEANKMLNIDSYMVHVIKRGYKRVLIITEDARVIEDARLKYPGIEFLFTDYPRDNIHDIGVAILRGQMDPTPEALNAITNLFLSVECSFFVGTLNSTWFKLMVMLSYGRNNILPPFVALDEKKALARQGRWGFFGMCTVDMMRKEIEKMKKKMDFPKA
mmetsp:Transcript_39065/g.124367  ORF Transcript_39065/g.124367 Transcript_39065/m.124367 type:complete len:395 (+) Transcript_39065:218-1402(+)